MSALLRISLRSGGAANKGSASRVTSSPQFTVPNFRTPIRTTGSGSAPAGTATSHGRTRSRHAHCLARLCKKPRVCCCRRMVGWCRMVLCNAGPTQREGGAPAGVSSRACRNRGIMAADLLHQPTPGLLLGGAGGLFHRDPEIIDLALDLVAGEEIEPAHQDRGFDHRGFRAIETLERRMRDAVHHATMEARAPR